MKELGILASLRHPHIIRHTCVCKMCKFEGILVCPVLVSVSVCVSARGSQTTASSSPYIYAHTQHTHEHKLTHTHEHTRTHNTHTTHAQNTCMQHANSVYGAVTEDVTCVQMVMEFAEHGNLRGMGSSADL